MDYLNTLLICIEMLQELRTENKLLKSGGLKLYQYYLANEQKRLTTVTIAQDAPRTLR